MDAALKALSADGTLGAVVAATFGLLAIVISVLTWVLKRLVDSAIAEKKEFGEFMKSLTSALNGLGLNFQANRSDTMAAVRDLGEEVKAEIQHVVWAAHDKGALLTAQAISTAKETIVGDITGLANSIRTSNAKLVQDIENLRLRDKVEELSRPHSITPTPGVVR